MKYQNIELVLENAKCLLTLDASAEKPVASFMHTHTSFELFCVWKGVVEIKTEDTAVYANAGQALLIAPTIYHSSLTHADAEKINVYFSIIRSNKRIQKENLYEKFLQAFTNASCTLFHNAEEIGQRLHKIREIWEHENVCKKERLQAEFTGLIFALYEAVVKRTESVPDAHVQASAGMQYRYEIESLLAHNYANDIDLDFLARTLYLSPKRVAVLIKKLYGKSFRHVKSEMKIQAAKQLLKESNLTVAEVAEKVGYKSMRGFLTAFVQMTGENPSAYRERKKRD